MTGPNPPITAGRPTAGHTRLTARQRHILELIRNHIDTVGYPPTIREIGKRAGLTSTASVHRHLRTLEEKGFLRRGMAGHSRAVVVIEGAAA